jgi:hypothetical protein
VPGGAAIDHRVRNAAPRGEERNGGGWVDRETRTQRDHQVRFAGGLRGPVQVLGNEALAEADGGGLQEPTAIAARRTAGLTKRFKVRFRFGSAVTGLAFDQEVRSVQFPDASLYITRYPSSSRVAESKSFTLRLVKPPSWLSMTCSEVALNTIALVYRRVSRTRISNLRSVCASTE